MPLTVNIEAKVINDVNADIKANLDPLQANIDAVVQSGDDKYVPFRLQQLPSDKATNATTEQMETASFRESVALYGDNGSGFRISLQQIKAMNTKIKSVETGQLDASGLTVGDFIYEKK